MSYVIAPNKVVQRFMDKVIVLDNDCWEWQGYKRSNGYGTMGLRYGFYEYIKLYAHQFAYLTFRGDIPKGMFVDHRECGNHACVNPHHLELVTPSESTIRSCSPSSLNAGKLFCIRGHPLTEANTLRHGPDKMWRLCRVCRRQYKHDAYIRSKYAD